MHKNTNYSISQNFLTSKYLINKLIKIAKLTSNDIVLEIGAGKGHITKALAERVKSVVSYEIDAKLYDFFLPASKQYQNLRLIKGDFLKYKLLHGEYKVFANIPFSITTEIIRKLTNPITAPTESWLIMEKGAAKRFMGSSGESMNSLLLKPFFKMEIVYHFKNDDFHPKPKADIVMLHISKKVNYDIEFSERTAYSEFITQCFNHGLSGKNAPLTKKQISTALRLEHLPEIRPGGDVLYIQWLCLFRCSCKFCGNRRNN